jgi:hypothetical protein
MDENLIKALGDKIDAMKNESVTKADYEALKAELDALKNAPSTELETLKSKLEELALEVSEKADKGEESTGKSFIEEVKEVKETLKAIASGQRGEIELKALTNRASISGNTNAYVLPDIGQLGVKRRSLYDVLPKVRISDRSNDNGIIKYHDWDEDTTVRAAAMVAEGGTFPESTAKFIERTLSIRKIGDTCRSSTTS